MSDLGTVSILVDVRGQPVVRELAKDLNNVAVAEAKVSAATQKVMADYRRTRDVMSMLKKTTDDTSASFQRFSVRDLQQASQRMQGFESALANTRRGMGQMGMATQQIGYQVGDFLVQVQSGTNFMVAFGQQATQLVGILPAFSKQLGMSVGSLIGISSVLGIAIPLLTAIGAVFMRTGEASAEATREIDAQKQAYDSLISRVQQLRLERQMEVTGIQTQEEQVVQNELNRLLKERADLQERLNSLSGNLGPLVAFRRGEVEAERDALQVELDRNDEAIKAITYQQQLETAAKRRANEERNAYREAKAEADRWKAALEGIKNVLDSINGMAVSVSLDLKSTASGWASEFMSQLTQGLENKAAYVKSVGAGRGLNMGGPELDPYGFRAQLEKDKARASTRSGAGSGGGRSSQLKKEIELTKELTQAEKDRQTILQSIEGSLESGFMSMVDGTKSVKSAFRSMAAEIIKELYRVLVVQRLVGAISGGIGMFSGPSTGSLGLPFGLATGGSVMPGKSYLVGENGPELVIPRHSGTVVNANQTAGATGGSGGVTVQNNITVTGSDAAMVRAEVAKMIPQITNATKAAVIDARLRGGQMKQAFR
jgi:hypothetical protein